jgi:hypothetical protein
MTHVAAELHELHAGQPNTFSVPLLDNDPTPAPLDLDSGSATHPTLTIVDLEGEEVGTVQELSGYWPFEMTQDSDTGEWGAAFTTLDVETGTRLRLVVSFTDPDGNPIELEYPAIVVPAV